MWLVGSSVLTLAVSEASTNGRQPLTSLVWNQDRNWQGLQTYKT